ncbi:DUF1493 family protein [Rosenbergiella nectarea]|uniref:DUF1493 family protein n=1 Tax=Rosenbergiella nectarea TaxID=988801 RepID=UPI001BDAE0D4|nr:DUF1493 family protein [Rosenbergiella nectarea]MBT0728736.1 DUF1493 family protein [Rosenbergiella nectarea subsp. apis]
MVKDAIQDAVLEWYDKYYNVKPLFSKKKPQLTLDTSLSTGKYPWARETGDDILNDYFKRFNVESSAFDLLLYWPYEKGFLPNVLRPLSQKIPDVPPKPLTLRMLVESAKAGRWLFN